MRHRSHRPHRWRPHLLGSLCGTRLGVSAGTGQSAGRDAPDRSRRNRIRSDGFLPATPEGKAQTLADHGLHGLGGFTPVVLYRDDVDPAQVVNQMLDGFAAVGAKVQCCPRTAEGSVRTPVPTSTAPAGQRYWRTSTGSPN